MNKDLKDKIDNIVIPKMEVVPTKRKKLFAKKQEEPQVEIPEVVIPKTKNEEYTEAVVRLRGSSKQTSAYKRRVRNKVGADSVDPIQPSNRVVELEPLPNEKATPYHDIFAPDSERITEMMTVERPIDATSERTLEREKTTVQETLLKSDEAANSVTEIVKSVTAVSETVPISEESQKTAAKKSKTNEKTKSKLKPISTVTLTNEPQEDRVEFPDTIISPEDLNKKSKTSEIKNAEPKKSEDVGDTLFTESARTESTTFTATTYIPFAWLHSLSSVNRPSKTYRKLLSDQQERALLLPVLSDNDR